MEPLDFINKVAGGAVGAAQTVTSMLPSTRRFGRGIIYNDKLGIRIDFQYDPEEIETEKTLNWNTSEVLGIGMPLISYGGGDLRVRRFKILLDAHASPHVAGNVATEIYNIELLSVPWDVDGIPTVKLASHDMAVGSESAEGAAGVIGGARQQAMQYLSGVQAPGVIGQQLSPFRVPPKALNAPGRVSGVPPLVKISYGGRVDRGVLRNLRIIETFHGTTPFAYPRNLPTRATVEFEFIIIEDTRMLVHWTQYAP
ncbi:MAG: hypothetical protein PHZ19_02775 [Candidatus Thermoplasmatota archaeon]|nr:hypothetical protein [Candidatus Thermoplasmatota archaeon]